MNAIDSQSTSQSITLIPYTPKTCVSDAHSRLEPIKEAIFRPKLPTEIWNIVIEFCSEDTRCSFSQVNHFFYFLVSDFYYINIRRMVSVLRSLPLKEDFEGIIYAQNKEKNKACDSNVISVIERRKKFKEYFYSKSIIKFNPPLMGELFEPKTRVLLNKDFMMKSRERWREFNLNGFHIAAEQFIRMVIFSTHLLKRGDTIKAASVFIKSEGIINVTNVTVGDLQEMGFLDRQKMPAIVWSGEPESTEKIENENVTSLTKISSVHAQFIFKKYFTLCTQDKIPDFEAYLRIPPDNAWFGLIYPETEESIVNDILKSNVFYKNSIHYNTNVSLYTHPFHTFIYNQPLFLQLVQNGFDVNDTNMLGQSALEAALSSNQQGRACFFMRHGATINWNSDYLDKLLWIAVRNADVEKVRKAIQLGANINARCTIWSVPENYSLVNMLFALREHPHEQHNAMNYSKIIKIFDAKATKLVDIFFDFLGMAIAIFALFIQPFSFYFLFLVSSAIFLNLKKYYIKYNLLYSRA